MNADNVLTKLSSLDKNDRISTLAKTMVILLVFLFEAYLYISFNKVVVAFQFSVVD